MKISKLIKQLQAMKKKHGNLEVAVRDTEGDETVYDVNDELEATFSEDGFEDYDAEPNCIVLVMDK